MTAHGPHPMRPWLLIDVDGVLNRMVSNSVGKKLGYRRARMTDHASGWRYTMHLDPGDGPRLMEMADAFDLAWCTTWNHAANDAYFARQLGLAVQLPVVDVNFERDDRSKVPAILRFVADRPFVWIDDDVSGGDVGLLSGAGVRSIWCSARCRLRG